MGGATLARLGLILSEDKGLRAVLMMLAGVILVPALVAGLTVGAARQNAAERNRRTVIALFEMQPDPWADEMGKNAYYGTMEAQFLALRGQWVGLHADVDGWKREEHVGEENFMLACFFVAFAGHCQAFDEEGIKEYIGIFLDAVEEERRYGRIWMHYGIAFGEKEVEAVHAICDLVGGQSGKAGQ